MTGREDMEAVVEAILFVANDPVPRDKLLEVFSEDERDEANRAVQAVLDRFRGNEVSGIMIDEAGGGLRLVTRPDLHGWLRRFFEVSGTNKLSMAALETLAIVAYRQPVTAPEISELRGVSSQGVLKTLLERRLVRIAGRKEVVGKPFLYATTREFLMHFGLATLKELPPLEQFEELFVGDVEAEADGPEDFAERADREAAEVEAAEELADDRAEIEEIELERALNESRDDADESEPDDGEAESATSADQEKPTEEEPTEESDEEEPDEEAEATARETALESSEEIEPEAPDEPQEDPS